MAANDEPLRVYDVGEQNAEKTDLEIREIFLYGAGLKSIRSVVGLSRFTNLELLSLHNNDIQRIEGLELLPSLRELNLSSNFITAIEGLSQLTNLRVLNLSCNRIHQISGLGGLSSLSRLTLSHNHIAKLSGIAAVSNTLSYLDLKDNLIRSLAELWQLAGCTRLEELVLSQGKHTNPVCQEHDYHSTLATALPQVKYVDRLALSGLAQQQETAVPQSMHAPNLLGDTKAYNEQDPGHRHAMDHELRGFVSRNSSTEHETRLGLLELRFSQLVRSLKTLQSKSEPAEDSASEEGSQAGRNKIRARSNLEDPDDGHSSNLENVQTKQATHSKLDQLCLEINHLQVELANVKEELLKRNKADHQQHVAEKMLKDKNDSMEPEETGKCVSDFSTREKIRAKVLALQYETSGLKEALEAANCSRLNAERALMDVTAEKESLHQSVENLSKSLDVEHANLKACNSELQSCRQKGNDAYEEVTRLSTLLAAERNDHEREIEHLKRLHEKSLALEVDRTSVAELQARAEAQELVESVRMKLKSAESQLQTALEERSNMAKMLEEGRRECVGLKEALTAVVQKEQEAEELVAALTSVVQSQKLKLQSAHHDFKRSAAAYEQQIESLRNEASSLRNHAARSHELMKELENLEKHPKEPPGRELVLQVEALKSENVKLREEIATKSERLTTQLEKLQAYEDALRIKTKMLDSQNDSIKELKLELARTKDALKESKCSTEFIENEWNARLHDEMEQGRALRKELAAQDTVIMQLEEELKFQKDAVIAAQRDYNVIQQKLKEKEEMLVYVEREINQVKSLYEKRIASDRDEVLVKLKSAIQEKEKIQCKVAELELQVEGLTSKFQKKVQDLLGELRIKEHELGETCLQLRTIETQLNDQRLATEKQKALSASKVSQLCKVLDELRAAS